MLYDISYLINIIDEILPEDESVILNDDEFMDLFESLLHIMNDYIHHNPKAISEEDFHEDFKENIMELMLEQFENNIIRQDTPFYDEDREDFIEQLELVFGLAEKVFFENIFPIRSYPTTFIINKPNTETLQKQIDYLSNVYQPEQRTPAWYSYRRDLITASNAYKAFESQSMQNQLIYEKCQPMPVFDISAPVAQIQMINTNTTLHWGQKYEPLSVMIYEFLYNTKVGEFGCIKHPKYNFLGASPDGININKDSDRFGRMLEIKNIVNREITGIPKKEYWIQMQFQMEVCDLDECDFLETKFTEYEDYDAFIKDGMFNETDDWERKGVIIQFIKKNGNPLYIYQPCSVTTLEEFNEWEETIMEEYEELTWLKNIYWKLNICSCVLVLRNKNWFENNIDGIEYIWKIIEKERIDGYEHRAPNKREKKEPSNSNEITENNLLGGGCLLGLNKETGKIQVTKLN